MSVSASASLSVVLDLYGSPFHTDIGLRPVRRLLERRCGIHRGSDPVERGSDFDRRWRD
jgi:hypothetical protein